MSSGANFDVSRIRDILHIDTARMDLAKNRQKKFWSHEQPDKLPIFCSAPLTNEQEQIPNPDLKEAFYDSDLMLCSQIRGVFAALNSGSDQVPSMRANMGTGNFLSLLGRNQEVFPDMMPWFKEHFTKQEISNLTPDDIKIRGDFELGLKHIKRFREIVPEVPVYCMDNQGPFDLAHLMLGDDIFLEIYDDPRFVHHLMDIAVELSIRGINWCKEAMGEPRDIMHHGNELYAENMGIRICEDTSAIVSPDTIDEFVIPYTRKLIDAFDGAWIHYCGFSEYLSDKIREIPNVRGINYGIIPGKENVHDEVFETEMEKIAASGKIFYGPWPIREGENGRDYLKRMHYWAKRGALLICAGYAIGGEDGFSTVKDAINFWDNL